MPTWTPIMVPLGGAAKSPDGFIVRDSTMEEEIGR
jgi:hypothetical protein